MFLGPVRPDPEQPADGGESAGAGAGVPGDALRLEPECRRRATRPLVPKLRLGTQHAKLCFALQRDKGGRPGT